MYFPFIRGRQYDLLALKELVNNNLISKDIIPIIEPIKLSSTYFSTIETFIKKDHPFVLIVNPSVGNLKHELKNDDLKNKFLSLLDNRNLIVGVNLSKDIDSDLHFYNIDLNDETKKYLLVHSKSNPAKEYWDTVVTKNLPFYDLVSNERIFKRKLEGHNLIVIDDKFNKLIRNADYLEVPYEIFTEEHLYFKKEGYIGFSDYSIVGEEFSDSGFAPYAVAIHIVFPEHDGTVSIAHFVSDSNFDTSDPAGKFSEALNKLTNWLKTKQFNNLMDTFAIRKFQEYSIKGSYPGLPTIKKLSIMHHLEVMSKVLSTDIEG